MQSIVIVGGGTAGWLTAARLASARLELDVTLIEAPDIPTIGVGEGTWPTMRATLAAIGIAESEFLSECDGAFKQGSCFTGWVDGASGDSYLHPFTPPPSLATRELLAAWQSDAPEKSFAEAMTPQARVCAGGMAPRQAAMPDYQGALNYAYHLDAGKFAALLMKHATQRLGVRHVADRVTAVNANAEGGIASVATQTNGDIGGDLFIDCSGHAALLIGAHCNVDWIDRSDVLFNDRALAAQVPVQPGSPIASQTNATAHKAGWIWDVGLPGRRGIGCVYASRFMDDDAAEAELRTYIAQHVPGAAADIPIRRLAFPTGHRERFWQGNCIAIGLSAGFIEPLEASAIVLIELSLNALIENFPASRESLPIHAERFNALFHYRWDRIVDFLKLHYVLSKREDPYWIAHREPAEIPARLAEMLILWRDQPPSTWDFPQVDEIFSAQSHQYILYGMGFPVSANGKPSEEAQAAIAENHRRARMLEATLPTNRDYLDAVTNGAHAPARQERPI